jgi:hypothetical protein
LAVVVSAGEVDLVVGKFVAAVRGYETFGIDEPELLARFVLGQTSEVLELVSGSLGARQEFNIQDELGMNLSGNGTYPEATK